MRKAIDLASSEGRFGRSASLGSHSLSIESVEEIFTSQVGATDQFDCWGHHELLGFAH